MAPPGAAKREVAEVGLELLYLELVKLCPQRPVLDAMGVQVGHQLAERYTADRTRFSDSLEVIKFICKEFWSEVFKKQIDNLKTNRHREIFVLQDNRFRWLRHVAGRSDDTSKAAELASTYLAYPCGMIKGALASLGVQCEVSAEVADITVGACAPPSPALSPSRNLTARVGFVSCANLNDKVVLRATAHRRCRKLLIRTANRWWIFK